jgi:hypothetical protein
MSTRNYNQQSHGDGQVVITHPEEDTMALSLRLEKAPEELAKMKTISFDVVSE